MFPLWKLVIKTCGRMLGLQDSDSELAGLVEEDPVSDEVLRSDETKRLYEAISQLPPIQQRRIMMLLEDMNCNQIAKAEGRHPSVIYRSVEKSFLHLRALLQG